MGGTSYQNKLEIFILETIKNRFLKYDITSELNNKQIISFYSYDDCCKEAILKFIYLTKCIIDLTVYPSPKIASLENHAVSG